MPAAEPNYEGMSVRELKTRIDKGGFSHSDCFEVWELRQRARQADAGEGGDSGDVHAREFEAEHSNSNSSNRKIGKGKKGGRKAERDAGELTQRRGKHEVVTREEQEMSEQVTKLVSESSSVSGRDASVILGDAEKMKVQVEEDATLSAAGKKQMLTALEEVNKNLAFETHFEKHCARFIQLAFLAVTIVPALLTFGEWVTEFATRPIMEVESMSLSGTHAVVTGGCGAVGLDLAIMLATSGAGVVISCHGTKVHEQDEVESRLAKLGLLHGRNGLDKSSTAKGWIEVWPLQLESFVSVREFAGRVAKEVSSLDILVHSAATKEGCSRTEDGHELATQVNYLSPFLLTNLLIPTMRADTARVVHVTCDAGLQQPDWLPWPLRRTQVELLPRVDLEGLKQRQEGKDGPASLAGECSPLIQYANTKLAVLVHSHELNRHLSGFVSRGVSHVLNPGSMDTNFGRNGGDAPLSKPSMRSSMMGYLPPVFIANKIYSFTIAPMIAKVSSRMLRSSETGAKALFHVATAGALGQEEHGGGLFSDTAGPFINCGKPAEECGRISIHKQPAAASDGELASELWERTKSAIGHRFFRALHGHSEPLDTSNSVSDVPATSVPDVPAYSSVSDAEIVEESSDDGRNSDIPPMTVKFASEQHGMQRVDFRAEGSMGDLFDFYCKQVGLDRQSLHFTIWGQDVDLKKSVTDTWNLLQLDQDDAVDVRPAD